MTANPRIKPTGATKPTKKELAHIKALSDLGHTPTAVAKKVGRSHHTVIKYLNSEVYNDPEIEAMVSRIKEKEIADLCLLGAKARKRLHELMDAGTSKVIETVALMDRAFQQRRLLEGASTQNIAIHTIVEEIEREEREVRERRANPAREGTVPAIVP